jgi:hypothetical protein
VQHGKGDKPLRQMIVVGLAVGFEKKDSGTELDPLMHRWCTEGN